ncbi:hypothetical protein LINPERPRIM_LOCUS41308 [Linum perenne]
MKRYYWFSFFFQVHSCYMQVQVLWQLGL